MKVLIALIIALLALADSGLSEKYDAFTNVNRHIPSIEFEMRYATEDNFIGRSIDGYHAPLCYLSNEAAAALVKVQQSFQQEGLALLVFDCYRPQRAVDHFVRWAKALDETKMKSSYYPNVDKKDLFREGYIAAKSGHSRGSTLDLTIKGLDMGTPFDFFDPRSHTDSDAVTKEQYKNRMDLKKVMEENGFTNYAEEWWHYTLKDEPFKERYFDFDIRAASRP
ncbi:MAG: M15 family metallopeptidase [Helicobacteraceae bacterium]|jgi:D-alanyl-D-alanine dipeptidase|nr:M15 family metallopeptidase [Helicobacteraceae bacterium]